MTRPLLMSIALLLLCSFSAPAQDEVRPAAFFNVTTFVGRHNIGFSGFADSPGPSFGFQASLGIYVVNSRKYRGGLHYTTVEGASYDENRRQTSEDFVLPDAGFDKHLIFNFAMFRSGAVGWFHQLEFDRLSVYHRIGIGIFGTTELDQLYNLGLHNNLGAIMGGDRDNVRWTVGLMHDVQIGSGNPNYSMSNIAFTVGGYREF